MHHTFATSTKLLLWTSGMAVARGVMGLSTILSHSPAPSLAALVPSAPCPSPGCSYKLSRSGILVRVSAAARKDGQLHQRSSTFENGAIRNSIGKGIALNSETAFGERTTELSRNFFSMAAAAADVSQTVTVEEDKEYKIQEQILSHQRAAAKLSQLEEARTVIDGASLGTISVISKKHPGFPVGSMVTYAADEDGSILLSLTSLSPRTSDLEENPKCSLLVPKDPHDRGDTVITIIGEARRVSEQDEARARAKFLKKHPGAFYVDFGDFRFVRLKPIEVKYITGIGTGLAAVAEFTGEQYQAASVDPISMFTAPIADHMNKDHSEQTAQIVEQSVGVEVESALITDVDRFGFNVKAKRKGKPLKLRIPFPRPAEDRKAVKALIVEMLSPKISPET